MTSALQHRMSPKGRASGGTAARAWAGDATSVIEFLRPLRPFLDAPDVIEMCVNQPGEIFVETQTGWHRQPVEALHLDGCLALATALATFTDQQISQERPLLAATLPSGERVQMVIPPAVPRGTVSITIRKPSGVVKALDTLEGDGLFTRLCNDSVVDLDRVADLADAPSSIEARLGLLLRERRHVEFLRLAVRAGMTLVVSGKTGAGKTTFMKALVDEVPRHERLITIEDAAELTLPHHANAVHLFYSKDGQGTAKVTAKSLLEASLRMRPDRLFLAEVRGDECFYFLRLAASGHPSITSVHAGSAALALSQMALMVRESSAGGGLRLEEIHELLRSVIDVVVQIDRDAAGRFVSDIVYEPRLIRSARYSTTVADRTGASPIEFGGAVSASRPGVLP